MRTSLSSKMFPPSYHLCLNEFSCVKDKPNVWRTLIIEMYRSLPVWGLQTPFDNEVVRFDAPLDITQIKPRDNEWEKCCAALGVLHCSGVVVFPIIFTNLKLYRFSVCPSLNDFRPFVWFSFIHFSPLSFPYIHRSPCRFLTGHTGILLTSDFQSR